MVHVEKSVSMLQHFEQYVGKQRRVELKSVGNFVAKTVLVESANQFSLEELCRTEYSLKYFFRSHIDHHTYGKTLKTTISIAYYSIIPWHSCHVRYVLNIKHNAWRMSKTLTDYTESSSSGRTFFFLSYKRQLTVNYKRENVRQRGLFDVFW